MRCDLLFAPTLYQRLPRRRPRFRALSPRLPCVCAQAGTDHVAVQVSTSKRLRRLGNTAEARAALDRVRAQERACAEYVDEDANVRVAQLLTVSNDGARLIAGANDILDDLEHGRILPPAAIAAASRVARAAATLHPSQRDPAVVFADRAFELLTRSRLATSDSVGSAVEALVGICAVTNNHAKAKQFVAQTERRFGYKQSDNMRSLLLLAASAAGNVEEAGVIADEFERRGEPLPSKSFAALAGEFASAGKHARAVDTLNSALELYGAGYVAGNDDLMLAVLHSCERANDARAARRVYDALKSTNTAPLPNVIAALLRAAFAGGDAKLGETLLLDEAEGVARKYKRGLDDLNRMVSAASRAPALSRRARAKEAQRLFERARTLQRADVGEYNVLLGVLARLGALSEARYVVDHLMAARRVAPNIVTYNTLLNACVVAGQPYTALQVFSDMRLQANQVTYNTLLNLAAESGTRELVDAVLRAMRSVREVEMGPAAVATLLKFYRRERDPDGARAAVAQLQAEQRRRGASPYAAPAPAVYVALLTIYLENRRHAEAVSLFGLLVLRRVGGPRPYNVLLQHHGARRRDAPRALQILAMMKRRGVAPDATSYTIAIRAAAAANKFALALRLLAEMQDVGAAAADTYAWTAVIDASGHAGRPNVALELLAQMRRGAPGAPHPDIAAYNAAIYAVGMNTRAGWRAARGVFELATRDGCRPDDVTYSALASVALRHRHQVREREVVSKIERALADRLERLRAEDGAVRRRKRSGVGEVKKLKAKLKRIRWLLENIGRLGEE